MGLDRLSMRGRVSWWRQGWATAFLLPVLVAALKAAAVAPLVHLLLGEHFGLSGGRGAPWPVALAIVGLIGFWSTRLLFRAEEVPARARIVSIALWVVVTAVWLSLEPDYDVPFPLRELPFLVTDHAYLLPAIILGFVAWWQGMTWANDPRRFGADALREAVRDAWIALVVGIVLAGWAGGEMGREALSSAGVAVPVAIVCSVALIAAGEVVAAREVAQRRGGRAPAWGRWLSLSGVVAGVVVVAALLVSLVVGPDALGTVFGSVLTLLRWAVLGIAYLMFGIIFVIYWLISGIVGMFGWVLPEMAPEQFPLGGATPAQLPMEEQETEQLAPEWILLIRWVAFGIGLLIAALIIWRFARARRAGAVEESGETSRERVFSADLARRQLRDLLRRRRHGERTRRLDLSRPPRTVREAYRYLAVLAARQGQPRADPETATRFSARLARAWPAAADPIADLTAHYHRVRYGDHPDPGPELEAAVADWQQVWRQRQEATDDHPK